MYGIYAHAAEAHFMSQYCTGNWLHLQTKTNMH